MAAIDLNLNPDDKVLRQFGLVSLVAFGVIGGLVSWRGGLLGFDFGESAQTIAIVLWAIGGVSALLGLIAPQANKPLFLLLIIITWPIGLVISYGLMLAFYFLLITPVGLFFKLTGRDSMDRKLNKQQDSYWIEHAKATDVGRYFKQF